MYLVSVLFRGHNFYDDVLWHHLANFLHKKSFPIPSLSLSSLHTTNSTKVVNLFFLDVCNLVHAHERKKSESVSFSDKKSKLLCAPSSI